MVKLQICIRAAIYTSIIVACKYGKPKLIGDIATISRLYPWIPVLHSVLCFNLFNIKLLFSPVMSVLLKCIVGFFFNTTMTRIIGIIKNPSNRRAEIILSLLAPMIRTIKALKIQKPIILAFKRRFRALRLAIPLFMLSKSCLFITEHASPYVIIYLFQRGWHVNMSLKRKLTLFGQGLQKVLADVRPGSHIPQFGELLPVNLNGRQ